MKNDITSRAYKEFNANKKAELNIERCPVCNWPMKEKMEDGCIPGNCSYRPHGKG